MLASHVYSPAGPPVGVIVALHGLMESGACLNRAAQRWAARGWYVVIPDLRGHGESQRWRAGELDEASGDLMVSDVVELLETMRWIREERPLVAFGHSAGGAVAACLVEREIPLSGLVLEDPFWRVPVTHRQDPEVAGQALRRLQQWQRLDMDELVASADPRWETAEARLWAHAKYRTDPTIVAHGIVIPQTPWPDLLERAKARDVAVHVITGTEGIGMTPAHREIIRSHGGTVTVLEGATHFVQRTARERFDAAVEAALAELTQVAA